MATERRPSVFFSFHYDKDVFRVQMVKQMGALEGDEPVSAPAWEQVWRKGEAAIQKWIDDNMKYKQCVIVLIGSETASRPWVKYEISKAWNERRPLMGIYIHNLNCPRNGTSTKGQNPFEQVYFDNGSGNLGPYVPTHNPNPMYAYDEIKSNIAEWVKGAVVRR